MLAILRTIEVFAILVAIGLPLNLALRPNSFGGFDARMLLAPTSGLAAVAIYGFMYLALGEPIRHSVGPFWIVLAIAWLVVAVRYGPKIRKLSLQLRALDRRLLARLGTVVAAFLIAVGFFLFPFLKQPDLVFWHYSGTDAYQYMRVAERDQDFSRWDIATLGPYDAALGFVTQDSRLFDSPQGSGSKPGTFALLAELSSLLGLLPHEVFSPLVAAVEGTLFLALAWFGRSFGVLSWLTPVYALTASLAMVVWFFGDNTFLGNMLTLPLVAGVFGLVDTSLTFRKGLYGGILLGAMMVIFPDGPVPVVAVGGLMLIVVLVQAWRKRRVLQVAGGFLGWIGTLFLIMVPMLGYLLRSANIFGFLQALPGSGSGASATSGASASLGHPIAQPEWIWPALNLNILPPEPLKRDQLAYLGLLVGLYAVCLGLAIWRRNARLVTLSLSFAVVLLAATLSGVVTDTYNLFRAAALFWLIPLALLLYGLSVTLHGASQAGRPRARLAHASVASAILLLLVGFARNDFRQFAGAWIDHLPDAQYTRADIADRRAITALVGTRTITASTEIPTFTGFANVLMLFSSLHLGTPNYFYNRLFFLPDDPPKDVAYTSDLVLRSLKYTDIYAVPASSPRLYHSTDYEVVPNDLIPFFDNDTLPQSTGFPTEFMKRRNISLSREFSKASDVKFFSREQRDVHIGLRFAAASRPAELRFVFDGQAPSSVAVRADGSVALPPLHVTAGLHTLTLEAPDKPAELDGFTLD